jgi:hypothetical protein
MELIVPGRKMTEKENEQREYLMRLAAKAVEQDILEDRIIDELKANGEILVVDDHNNGTDTHVIHNFVKLANGEICACFENTRHFCLNLIYIGKDDRLHISTCSVGGVVHLRGSDLNASLVYYNIECASNSMWDIGCTNAITRTYGKLNKTETNARRRAIVDAVNNYCFGDNEVVAIKEKEGVC